MISFKKQWIAGLAAGWLLATVANAQHPKTVERETAAETDTQSVVLPSGPGSSLIVGCPGCKPFSLRATETTTYQLRNQYVSLKEFREAILGKQANMIVVYDTKTREVRRVKASVDPPPPVKRR